MVRKIVKGFANIMCHIIYRFDTKGLENIPKEGAAIICANHIHLLDSVTIVIHIKRMIYIMVKKELMKSKIGYWFFDKLGCFAVDRGKGDVKAIEDAEGHVKDGDLLMIFPEGKRNGMAKGIKMKKGAAMIALQTKTPIIPVGISGSFKLFTKVKIRIGKPMDLTEYFAMEKTGPREWITVTKKMEEEIISLRDGE